MARGVDTKDIAFYGPHEIHVTTDPLTTDRDLFARVCGELGVKAHVIYNETPAGNSVVDYLTGSDFTGSSEEAAAEMGRIAIGLQNGGLNVVRQKIETTPWHPDAPKLPSHRMPEGSYFESHFTLPDLQTIHGLRHLKWRGVPMLISSTDNKRRDGLLFATLRHYTSSAPEFCRNIDQLYDALSTQIGELKKPVVEFALFDSSPDHDREWVSSYSELELTDIDSSLLPS